MRSEGSTFTRPDINAMQMQRPLPPRFQEGLHRVPCTPGHGSSRANDTAGASPNKHPKVRPAIGDRGLVQLGRRVEAWIVRRGAGGGGGARQDSDVLLTLDSQARPDRQPSPNPAALAIALSALGGAIICAGHNVPAEKTL